MAEIEMKKDVFLVVYKYQGGFTNVLDVYYSKSDAEQALNRILERDGWVFWIEAHTVREKTVFYAN